MLNEAVRRAEHQAGCTLEKISREGFPVWTGARRGQMQAPSNASSAAVPAVLSIDRLLLALEKVAEGFLLTVGAIPSIKAANEYIQLPGYLNEPAMMAAFMTVALAATKKYETFFESQVYVDFRNVVADRMVTVLAEPYVRDLGQDGARRHLYSIVDHELSRCRDAVSQSIHNFIDEKPYPMNPVFSVINSRLRLSYKQDAAGEFSPADIEQNYRSIFAKLNSVASAVI